jgi:hypothetical protein
MLAILPPVRTVMCKGYPIQEWGWIEFISKSGDDLSSLEISSNPALDENLAENPLK